MAKFLGKLIKTGITAAALAGAASVAYKIAKKAVKVTVNNSSEEIEEPVVEPETAEDSLFVDDEISGDEADENADRHYVNIKVEDEKKDVNIDIDMNSIREEAGKLKDEAVSLTKTIIESVKSTASDLSDRFRDGDGEDDKKEAADDIDLFDEDEPLEEAEELEEPEEGSEGL